MSDSEQLHFKIGLSGTYWSKSPVYSILVNDKIIVDHKTITAATDEVFYEEFDYAAQEGPMTLKIRLENKDNGDTVENEDKTAFIKDMVLNIKTVEIDEIDIGNLIYTNSKFVGDDPARPVLDNCINLGWNGAWTFPFESPFYIWLLTNL